MFTECRTYLIEKLKAAGLHTPPLLTTKALAKSQDSHLGAVLLADDTLLRNGSKTYFKDETGATRKRRRVFDRDLAFAVLFGDYTVDKAEGLYLRFVAGLDKGIWIDGDYVPITVDSVDWEDQEDSILLAKVSIKIAVLFHGSVYRDTDFARIKELEVVSITKEEKNG